MAIELASHSRIERLNKLAEGGEATIYEYNSKRVIKIFKPSVDLAKKERKVNHFISIRTQFPKNVIGPEEVVTVNDEFVGYAMKKLVGAEDLHMLTKPKYLSVARLSNRDVLQIITELGLSLKKLHSIGVIVGDISDYNFQINGKSIYFIDVDSWGFEREYTPDAYTEYFTCPDSYAPNGSIIFSKENENYNFAVLAFNMLTRIHPFGGTYLPDKSLSILERMKKKLSVVGSRRRDIKIPKIIDSWKWMSPQLEKSFLEIFERGKKIDITPDLQELLNNMQYCSTHDIYYYSKFTDCPICNEHAKIKRTPVVAKVTQTTNGPQITIVFDGKDCAYILSNVYYLNKSGEAVHFETGRKFAIAKGKKVDFSYDGEIVYVADDNTIEIYDANNQVISVIERMHKSNYIVKERNVYYIDRGNNLVKLSVTQYGNLPQYLGQVYKPFFEVTEDGKVFTASMYPKTAIITTPDYTFKVNYIGKINEYAIKYDKHSRKWLFVYQMPNGKYRTLIFAKNKIEYDDDIIGYNAQPLSNIDFFNNTIYDPADGRIIGTNILRNTAKVFKCSVVDESSRLQFTGHGFKIYNRNSIYNYG